MMEKDMMDHQKIRMKSMDKMMAEMKKNGGMDGRMKKMMGKGHSEVRKMMEE